VNLLGEKQEVARTFSSFRLKVRWYTAFWVKHHVMMIAQYPDLSTLFFEPQAQLIEFPEVIPFGYWRCTTRKLDMSFRRVGPSWTVSRIVTMSVSRTRARAAGRHGFWPRSVLYLIYCLGQEQSRYAAMIRYNTCGLNRIQNQVSNLWKATINNSYWCQIATQDHSVVMLLVLLSLDGQK